MENQTGINNIYKPYEEPQNDKDWKGHHIPKIPNQVQQQKQKVEKHLNLQEI